MSEKKTMKKSKVAKGSKTTTVSKYQNPDRYGLALSNTSSKYLPRPRPNVNHNVAGFTANYNKMQPEEQNLIDTILDPDAGHDIRWPNTYGLSSVYKSVNTINALFDANKQSIAVCYPRLSNSIFTTAGSSFAQDLVAVGTSAGNFLYQDVQCGSNTGNKININAPFFFGAGHVVLPIPVTIAGNLVFAYPISILGAISATPSLTAHFTNIGQGNTAQITFTMGWLSAAFAVSAPAISIAVNAGGSITPIPAIDVAAKTAAQSSYVYFYATNVQGHPYIGESILEFRGVAGGNQIQCNNIYTHCISTNLNGANVVSQSSEEFSVIAMSMLLTSCSSSLNDGGVCAITRCCAQTTPADKSDTGADIAAGGNQYYNWISSLGTCYEGKIKDGCYAFYVGDDESDYFYKPVEQQQSRNPFLIAAFNTTEPAPAGINVVRIKIISHIQFKSNSNIYALKPSPYMKNLGMLTHILSLVDPAYSNDGHKDGLKNQLKSVGKQIGKALVSPKTWMTVAEVMAMLAL